MAKKSLSHQRGKILNAFSIELRSLCIVDVPFLCCFPFHFLVFPLFSFIPPPLIMFFLPFFLMGTIWTYLKANEKHLVCRQTSKTLEDVGPLYLM